MEDLDRSPQAAMAELEHLRQFTRERFRSGPEAASFLGGPDGPDAVLSFEEFARVLRLSGYPRPAEPLFASLGRAPLAGGAGVGVLVRHLLRDCGLPHDALPGEGVYMVLSPQRQGAAGRAGSPVGAFEGYAFAAVSPEAFERDPGEQLRALRAEVATLRRRVVAPDAEEQEDAWHADDADLRAAVSGALRLLAEDRRERQGSSAEGHRRIRELQAWAEERLQRVEALAKDSRQGVQEAFILGEQSESRTFGAISDEARHREFMLEREQILRESMFAELEGHFRKMIQDERLLRTREADSLEGRMDKFERMLQAEREANSRRVTELAAQIEEVGRGMREESGTRALEISRLAAHRDRLSTVIGDVRVAARDDIEAALQQCTTLESIHEGLRGQMEAELAVIKQSIVDLRHAFQDTASANEARQSRMQALVDDEVHARQEAVGALSALRDSAEARAEQRLRELLFQERCAREDVTAELERNVAQLQQELSVERSRFLVQSREIADVVARTRDTVTNEAVARRQDAALAGRAGDEVRAAICEGEERIDRLEARIAERLAALDAARREESAARLEVERRAVEDRGHLRALLQREMAAFREDFEARVARGEEHEGQRRLSAAAADEDCRGQLEQLAARHELLLSSLEDARAAHEKALQRLELRVQHSEQALGGDRGAREDRERAASARLAEITAEVAEARGRAREVSARYEELAALREALGRERLERQEGEGRLEVAIREQQARMEQLMQDGSSRDRGLERQFGELRARLDAEAKQRAAGDADLARQVAGRREELLGAMAAEGRRMEAEVAKVAANLREFAAEERESCREAIAALDVRLQQQRDAAEEASKWRIEQYSDLAVEVSKVSDMLAEEAKSRQQDVQELSGSLARVRDEVSAEPAARRAADAVLRDEVADAIKRMEQSETATAQRGAQLQAALEALRRDSAAEASRQGAVLDKLRQDLEREAAMREELLSGASRLWTQTASKVGEETRAALRAEAAAREEAQLRVEQQLIDFRGALREVRAVCDHREDEVTSKLQAAADALELEDQSRRAHEADVRRRLDDLRGMLAAEGAERQSLGDQLSGRVQNVEESLHEEATARDDGHRRLSKELLEARALINEERSVREGFEGRYEQLLEHESFKLHEIARQEAKVREDGLATITAALLRSQQTSLQEREEDRADSHGKFQRMHEDLQLEIEERSKISRDHGAALTRLQRTLAEEEEARTQESDRLHSAIEGLQDAVRGLSAGRDDTLQRSLDAVDVVRAALHKEVASRSSKVEALEVLIRELRASLNEEAQRCTAEVRAVAESLGEERAQREAALARERRVTEEELTKARQQQRKQREEEERRLQERLLDVTGAVSEERDQRLEAARQERQRNADVHEQLKQESKALQREAAKVAHALQKALDEEARRAKVVDAQLAGFSARCEEVRAGQVALMPQREEGLQRFEQRLLELEAMLRVEADERRGLGAELKHGLENEAALREDSAALERRAREAGDAQLQEQVRAAFRDDRALWEAALADLSKEMAGMRAQLLDDAGRQASERGAQQAAIQQLRGDLGELLGERKAEAGAVQESLEELCAEVVKVQNLRREDLERLDGVLASLGARLDQTARGAREQASGLEETLQGLQEELHREVEDRGSAVRRLEARIAEERRLVDSAFAVEARAREDVAGAAEESIRQRFHDEARKAKGTLDRLVAQVLVLSEDIEKVRAASPEQQREFTKGFAALQKQFAAEEQQRHQALTTLQRGLDALRDELLVEAKERRGQHAATSEEVAVLQRSLVQRGGERGDAPVQLQLANEVSEIRERLAREVRTREVAISQVEQKLTATRALVQGSERRTPSPPPAASLLGTAAGFVPSRDRWRQLEEEAQKTQDALAAVQVETKALTKAVRGLEERSDPLHSNLGSASVPPADAQRGHKATFELEQQIAACREEVRKEGEERRSECAQLAARIDENAERIDWTEQQRVKGEGALRQEFTELKTGLAKEVRERDAAEARLSALVREESLRREEGIDREHRARKEGEERLSEAFQHSLREERRARERAHLKLEDRALASTPGTAKVTLALPDVESRNLQQAVVDLRERVGAAEARQKSAEERTVSMLDAIMSGLMGPVEH